ncbi:MAG: hypothetical protein WA154_11005 [Moraxellaceae bacterium]
MKKSTKRPSRPIYFTARKLVDPETGEMVGALVPSSDIDRHLMRQRGFKTGQEVRCDPKQPRNPKFNRLVHVLGQYLVEHVEGFENLDCHGAIKRVQLEAGVACEVVEIDATPVVSAILAVADSLLGAAAARMLAAVLPDIKTVPVKQAASLSFDAMPEDKFRQVWDGVCRHVAEHYWPDLDQDVIEQMAGLMPDRRVA